MKIKDKETEEQYNQVMDSCYNLFTKKNEDYGSSWRVLRPVSITDQIFIKAKRIRQLQESEEQKVDESEVEGFMAIINYSIMALIQIDLDTTTSPDLDLKEIVDFYIYHRSDCKNLMLAKNHDYGEAWREMRVESITDLIIQKLIRIKSIEDNNGKTKVSEGLEANYQDILNYAVFAIINISTIETKNN